MFHLQNYKTMKANVQISAVKKEFKKQGSAAEGKANGQQGWQVFVEGMEGKLRCEMNFRDALKAIRYSFLLSKKLNLQINEVQLAALSLDYKQSKSAVEQAQVAEVATEVAQEVAAEAEQGEPSDEKSEAAHEFVCCSKMQKFREEHPDAVVIGRKGSVCEQFGEDAKACAAALGNTAEIMCDGTPYFVFDIEYLDECIQKLVASGKKVCLWDIFKGEDNIDEINANVQAQIAQNKVEDSPLFKQFCDLKKNHPDALLLFRTGDVYKCYEEDAIKAAEVLCLTNIVEEDKITIASFPHHCLDTYLPRLIRHGIRVAICDDITDFCKPAKHNESANAVQQELFTEA